MILVAPTSFKGTIGAAEAAAALAAGARAGCPERDVVQLPLSDGGPGLLDALRHRARAQLRFPLRGPLGEPTTGRALLLDGLAVVESADACGLHLVPPDRRDPLRTTTSAVGTLLLAAARAEGSLRVVGMPNG